MKRAIKIAVGLILLGGLVFSQEASGLKPATTILLQDEGVNQGRIKTLNCTGAGVTCSASGIVGTANITGGGGGGGNFLETTIDLTSGGMTFQKTVTGQAWVGASSIILCGILGTTADGLTPETIAAAGLTVSVANRVAATGFDIFVENAYGLEGTVRIHCTGA